ncbi:MAG: tyrosine-type recombinase/integrase, partial [Bacteroidales bacterium]|nr:tyrosine-type recombinase/integrase [Bacteroidales bacterium]
MSDNTPYIQPFLNYLRLERGLATNSNESYDRDVRRLFNYLESYYPGLDINQIELSHLREFITELNKAKLAVRSQARTVSGIKSFFKFLIIEKIIDHNPASLLEGPKIGRHLPEVLKIEEIESIISGIDLSQATGFRNKTIIEVLYGCGLRVSECIGILRSQIHFKDGYIQVIGKGHKERLVPLGGKAHSSLRILIKDYLPHSDPKPGFEDHIFLNKFGKSLSRVMIFQIVKQLSAEVGIKKTISPHTFRHS